MARCGRFGDPIASGRVSELDSSAIAATRPLIDVLNRFANVATIAARFNRFWVAGGSAQFSCTVLTYVLHVDNRLVSHAVIGINNLRSAATGQAMRCTISVSGSGSNSVRQAHKSQLRIIVGCGVT